MGLGWTLEVVQHFKSTPQRYSITKFYDVKHTDKAVEAYTKACLQVEPVGAKAAFSAQSATGQASQIAVFPDFDGDGIPDRARIASSNSVVVELLAADGSIRPGKTLTI